MKIEFETRENGTCKYFKVNGQDIGTGIYRVIIEIDSMKKPKIILEGKPQIIKSSIENADIEISKGK